MSEREFIDLYMSASDEVKEKIKEILKENEQAPASQD